MPWNEATPKETRLRFVLAYRDGLGSMTELCGANGISCPTGCKWVERFGVEGMEGLMDRSRAPTSSPQRTFEVTSSRRGRPEARWPRAKSVNHVPGLKC